jgi:hypothetical protein
MKVPTPKELAERRLSQAAPQAEKALKDSENYIKIRPATVDDR